MLYHGYDSYGYKEEETFKTIAEQKGFEFDAPKNVSVDVLSYLTVSISYFGFTRKCNEFISLLRCIMRSRTDVTSVLSSLTNIVYMFCIASFLFCCLFYFLDNKARE